MINLKEYMVKDGDTIQMVAQRELGDATRWLEIVILNDLNHPYIVRPGSGTSPKTVTTGDKIFIPIEIISGQSTETIVNQSDELLYGSDLLLDDGDLEADQYGDLRIAPGLRSLSQDLRHRLRVEVGTLPYHPEYGSYLTSIIGKKLDPAMMDKASIEISRCLRSDPRVSDIQDVEVTKVSTGILYSCTVVTKTSSFKLSDIA